MLPSMNSVSVGSKKPAVCRYFANSGSCFYGSECQFLHGNGDNTVNDAHIRDTQTPLLRHSDGHGSHSPAIDPLFQAFSSPSNLPPESKLQTYINATNRVAPSPSNDKSKAFMSNDISSAMACLNLDSCRKTPMSSVEFVPMAVNQGRLTHSLSTPSFSQFNVPCSVSASTPFGKFCADQSGQNLLGSHVPSPGMSPQHSPLMGRRSRSPSSYFNANTPLYQESVAGTTYFYSSEESNSNEEGHSSVLPDYHVYPGNPSHVEHMRPKANAPSFFLPDELRMDILHRLSLSMAQANVEQYPDLPSEVDAYHNLCPLESSANGGTPTKSTTFGFVTSVYKATNIKSGIYYCLRRIHGFRLSNTKCMSVVDLWKKLQHSNTVHLREVFTTKAFGDHSIVFVYDYHPGADTLLSQYFSQVPIPPINGYPSSIYNSSDGRLYSQNKSGLNNLRQHAGLLPESLIWAYIVQLSSALRTIHAAGLACRAFDPTKILITGKSRLRLNCCGIFDILSFDASHTNIKALTPHFQQEDLMAFGKVVLALACNSLVAVQRENLQTSLELVARNYSADLRNLILYLLSNQSRSRNINDIMPMIGARFYTQLDAAQMRSDVIENELAKEVENGRLLRLLVKLGSINERPEFHMDPSWSETGDRYLLKLFRDYLFHQVTDDGRPWLDMAHIVQCLNKHGMEQSKVTFIKERIYGQRSCEVISGNLGHRLKLDAGIPEKLCLMSRDEQNVLVVTYTELKQYFESSFGEILSAAALPKVHPP